MHYRPTVTESSPTFALCRYNVNAYVDNCAYRCHGVVTVKGKVSHHDTIVCATNLSRGVLGHQKSFDEFGLSHRRIATQTNLLRSGIWLREGGEVGN